LRREAEGIQSRGGYLNTETNEGKEKAIGNTTQQRRRKQTSKRRNENNFRVKCAERGHDVTNNIDKQITKSFFDITFRYLGVGCIDKGTELEKNKETLKQNAHFDTDKRQEETNQDQNIRFLFGDFVEEVMKRVVIKTVIGRERT
jgi:hypothetical protein